MDQGEEYLAKGSDGATLAGLTAFGTLLKKEDLIMRSAIEVALKLVTIATLELDTTLFATEVARMHELTLHRGER